jgi:hypothetical protein
LAKGGLGEFHALSAAGGAEPVCDLVAAEVRVGKHAG